LWPSSRNGTGPRATLGLYCKNITIVNNYYIYALREYL
jgi:hypothetical protein